MVIWAVAVQQFEDKLFGTQLFVTISYILYALYQIAVPWTA